MKYILVLFVSILTLTLVNSYSDQSNNEESKYEYKIINDYKTRWKRDEQTELKMKKYTKKAYSTGLDKPLTVKEKAMINGKSGSLIQTSTVNNNTEEINKNVTNTQATTQLTSSIASTLPTITKNISTTEITVDNVDTDFNKTGNITEKVDNHEYYMSTLHLEPTDGLQYWIDLNQIKDEKIITHETLSNSHRKAITVELKFIFPFYGHPIKNLTIATGGFLYTGGSVHTWLAATQYIAPLMANFDTSISNESLVQYYDNGTCFIVQWTKVRLQEDNRTFTFQSQLYSNGKIVFVYKELPISVSKISDDKHPVKVGISDAYIVERSFFFLRRKTIFEYHRVEFNKPLKSGSAIVFDPLPTCNSFNNCMSCLTTKTNFTCNWCPKINRCSSGIDRYRQEWLMEKCDDRGINSTDKCPTVNDNNKYNDTNDKMNMNNTLSGRIINTDDRHDYHHNDVDNLNTHESSYSKASKMSGGSKAGLISIVMIISIISGIAMWIFYAYKNPQSSSGQMLIKYRPARWNWNGFETRYTAASIHM